MAEELQSLKMTLSTTEANGQIRYTLDGTEPSMTSTLYSTGTNIDVPYGSTLKAKTFVDGKMPSITMGYDNFTYEFELQKLCGPEQLFTGPTQISFEDVFRKLEKENNIYFLHVYGSSWSFFRNNAQLFYSNDLQTWNPISCTNGRILSVDYIDNKYRFLWLYFTANNNISLRYTDTDSLESIDFNTYKIIYDSGQTYIQVGANYSNEASFLDKIKFEDGSIIYLCKFINYDGGHLCNALLIKYDKGIYYTDVLFKRESSSVLTSSFIAYKNSAFFVYPGEETSYISIYNSLFPRSVLKNLGGNYGTSSENSFPFIYPLKSKDFVQFLGPTANGSYTGKSFIFNFTPDATRITQTYAISGSIINIESDPPIFTRENISITNKLQIYTLFPQETPSYIGKIVLPDNLSSYYKSNGKTSVLTIQLDEYSFITVLKDSTTNEVQGLYKITAKAPNSVSTLSLEDNNPNPIIKLSIDYSKPTKSEETREEVAVEG